MAGEAVPVRRIMKRFVNSVLERRGYRVARASLVPSVDRLVSLIIRYGLSPKTVFDIGVAQGTPWLYKAFPEAHFYLIDPTQESLPYMEQWSKRIHANILNLALGDSCGLTTIRTRNTIEHATMLEDVTGPKLESVYEVPMKRFDQEIDRFDRPALCKIDVEGAEMMVLRGMGTRIRDFDIFVVECSMSSLYKDGPNFGDIAQVFSNHSFGLYDVIAFTRRPYDDALHQIDAVFVPEDSPLRSDRRWA